MTRLYGSHVSHMSRKPAGQGSGKAGILFSLPNIVYFRDWLYALLKNANTNQFCCRSVTQTVQSHGGGAYSPTEKHETSHCKELRGP